MVGVSRAKKTVARVRKPPTTPEIAQLRALGLRQQADELAALAAGFYADKPTVSVDNFMRALQAAKRRLETKR